MEPIISLKNITFRYQADQIQPALQDLSLTVNKGEWVAIIGHNAQANRLWLKR